MRVALRLTIAVALAIVNPGCGGSTTRLQFAGGQFTPSGLVLGSMRTGEDGDVGAILVCLTQPGRATITAVRPVNPNGGLRVSRFAVRLNPYLTGKEGLGGGDGSLSAHGFGRDQVVEAKCGVRHGGAVADEIGLELSRPSSRDAAAAGLDIDYRLNGRRGRLWLTYALALCSDSSSGSACKSAVHGASFSKAS
jgi:hypothetical protein